jgi:ArsR family transcriptional regulator
MAAGALAEALGIPNSSLSFHLAHLTRAGLIGQRREGRSLIYTPNTDAMFALIGFLTENCCGGADCTPVQSDPLKASRGRT